MKRILAVFILTLSFGCCFAQFAKIVDKDGFVNVRERADIKSKVKRTIKSGEIVYVSRGNDGGSWMQVDYYGEDGNISSGYIHISRLRFIDSYQEIPSVSDDENGASFIMRNFDITIRSEKFDYTTNKKYFGQKQFGSYSLDTYKGQAIWGFSGAIPKTHYISITVRIGNQVVEIPEKEFENLFEIDNESAHCFYDEKSQTLFITSINADGSDTYEVLWVIESGKYNVRKVFNATI